MKNPVNLQMFNSHQEFNYYIESETRKLCMLQPDYEIGKLHPADAAIFIDLILDLTYEKIMIKGEAGYKWYYREHNSHLYKELTMQTIGVILVNIAKGCQCTTYDIRSLSFKTLEHLRILADGEEIKSSEYRRPPSELLSLTNGILNLKTKVFYPVESAEYLKLVKQYHFFNDTDIAYYETPQNLDKYNFAKSYLESLADQDESQLELFKKILFAIIEGNGRHKYFIISGPQGAGKSTFGYLCTALAGQKYTQLININRLGNSNAINNISSETKLILGDDLRTNAHIYDNVITNFKTLVDGNALSVAVKYEPNRIIKTNAVWVQLMINSKHIRQNNKPITDRTIFIHLTGTNHRRDTDEVAKEMSYRLRKYLGRIDGNVDNEFISELASEILRTVPYFEEFTIPKNVAKDTNNMIYDNDWAYQFAEYAKEVGLFHFNGLRLSELISMVKQFIIDTNPSMKMPSSKLISKSITPYLEKNGFILSDKLSRPLSCLDYNNDVVNEYMFENVPVKKTPSKVFWNVSPEIDDTTVSEFKELIANYKIKPHELSINQRIMLDYLIKKGDLDAIDYQTKFDTEN